MAGNPQEEYLFFNGTRIARRDVSSTGTTIALHYYFSDHLGTHAVVENATGTQCEQDIDYYPYGGQQNDYCTTPVVQGYKFNGKERDGESGLDNFGARYDTSNLGRFMTPDPLFVTPLHVVNPQRWNMYAYVVNNPTNYVDPDGKDAIAVNFQDEVPVVGHEGIISVHHDGAATYSRFGPATEKRPFDKGKMISSPLSTKVQFNESGLPTMDSYEALAKEVAGKEGQDPNTVRMNYFKTSDADTNALDNWIRELKTHQLPPYAFCSFSNCVGFTASGLFMAHAINSFEASQLSIVPNIFSLQLDFLSNQNYKPKPHITKKLCNPDGTNCVTI